MAARDKLLRRFETLRRDLHSIAQDFRGERRPLVERRPAAPRAVDIRTQRGPSAADSSSPKSSTTPSSSGQTFNVAAQVERRVTRDGVEVLEVASLRSFAVPADKTILEAAEAAGITLPNSCRVGGCGACMAQLQSGTADVPEPNCLSVEERASGFVLPCVSRPKEDIVIRIAAKRPKSRLAKDPAKARS